MKLSLRFYLLIGFLLYVLFFVGFNLEKTVDISVVFWTFTGAPTFFVVMTAFILGAVFPLPFLQGKKNPAKSSSGPQTTEALDDKPLS